MIRIMALWYMVLILYPISCQSAELQSPLTIRGVGQFYRTAPGSLAFIPYAESKAAAEKAVRFKTMVKSGAYKIRSQSSYWFIVNHKTNEDPEATYLGVEIIPIYSNSITPQTPVFLKRSDKWFRENDPDFVGDSVVKKAFESKTIEEFINSHQGQAELSDVDKSFFKWHGSPLGSSKQSWMNRMRWKPSVAIYSDEFRNSFSPPIPKDSSMMVNGLLIRFETTTRVSNYRPVVFGFNGAEPIAAYVKVFAPDAPEYDKELFLTFD